VERVREWSEKLVTLGVLKAFSFFYEEVTITSIWTNQKKKKKKKKRKSCPSWRGRIGTVIRTFVCFSSRGCSVAHNKPS